MTPKQRQPAGTPMTLGNMPPPCAPEPEDPNKPLGQKYGYGIAQMTFGPNSLYFHGGEMPGYNSFIGHDPVNDVTLIVWTNLTISLDGKPTANPIMLKMVDRIYTLSPLQQSQ
jgi:D-alanyl-D-alanine carboxypeptidase